MASIPPLDIRSQVHRFPGAWWRDLSTLSIRRGATWFISDMPLFFVPAVLAVLDHRELLGALGLKIVATILGSTSR
jgi:putative effector of murein hydrolase LrgA (UPF0299 family)